jgi:hypothetical protein
MSTYQTSELFVASTDDLPWACAPARGVSYKSLRFDPDTGAGVVLIHMTPHTRYPQTLAHDGMDVIVLDGEATVAGHALQRGGFAHVPPGTVDQPATTKGCVLYATFSGRIEHVHPDPIAGEPPMIP